MNLQNNLRFDKVARLVHVGMCAIGEDHGEKVSIVLNTGEKNANPYLIINGTIHIFLERPTGTEDEELFSIETLDVSSEQFTVLKTFSKGDIFETAKFAVQTYLGALCFKPMEEAYYA